MTGPAATTAVAASVTTPTDPHPPVTITILYDNWVSRVGTRSDWGFACLVSGREKTVLFDTGKDGEILLSNMQALGIRSDDIDMVVLSHAHSDHTGGLLHVVTRSPAVAVYHPVSLSAGVIKRAQAAGAHLRAVEASVVIGQGLRIIGPLGSPAESALLVDTPRGHVLVTGCAHPGVVEMATAAADVVDGPVYAVIGGFHLLSHSAGRVDQIIRALKDLGVERCGPAHCTGEAATAQMRAAFGEGFIETGVGATVTF